MKFGVIEGGLNFSFTSPSDIGSGSVSTTGTWAGATEIAEHSLTVNSGNVLMLISYDVREQSNNAFHYSWLGVDESDTGHDAHVYTAAGNHPIRMVNFHVETGLSVGTHTFQYKAHCNQSAGEILNIRSLTVELQ